jgi:hypothetical protein
LLKIKRLFLFPLKIAAVPYLLITCKKVSLFSNKFRTLQKQIYIYNGHFKTLLKNGFEPGGNEERVVGNGSRNFGVWEPRSRELRWILGSRWEVSMLALESLVRAAESFRETPRQFLMTWCPLGVDRCPARALPPGHFWN